MKNGDYTLIVPPKAYPGKRYRGKYAYEHRVSWWKRTGKNPDDHTSHVIHHKNENKRDNDPKNVVLKSWSAHSSIHQVKAPMTDYTCQYCGCAFQRPRSFKFRKFCSKRCAGYRGY